nr:site-specific integrase [Micromonospora sp. DSM 115978]
MAVDDTWYLSRPGPGGERRPASKHGRGKRWRVRYVDDAGRPRERLFAKKADAERYDAGVRTDVARGLYIDPEGGRKKVADYWDEWRVLQEHDAATREKVERIGRLHIRPTTLGGMEMGRVRRSHVQGWAISKGAELSSASIHGYFGFLTGMFRAAVIDRDIAVSPCLEITLPQLVSPTRYIAAPGQIHTLADQFRPAADDDKRWPAGHVRGQVYVGAGGGLRQGEIWGLELDHIDWLRREIHVRQQLKMVTGGPPYLALPKSGLQRTVELSDPVSIELAEHIRRYPVREIEIEDRTDPNRPRVRKAQMIFLSSTRRPWRRNGMSELWIPRVAQAGLPVGFGMHNLRHFFATSLIHNGATVGEVQRALGHSSPTITLNRYLGEWPEAVGRTRTIIGKSLGRADRTELRAVTG